MHFYVRGIFRVRDKPPINPRFTRLTCQSLWFSLTLAHQSMMQNIYELDHGPPCLGQPLERFQPNLSQLLVSSILLSYKYRLHAQKSYPMHLSSAYLLKLPASISPALDTAPCRSRT